MLKISMPWIPIPIRNSYNGQLRKRTLGLVLWGVMLTSIILGINNVLLKDWPAAMLMFSLSLLCVFGLEANERGKYVLISGLTTLVILIVAFYSTLEGGGIHDPGVLVYPIIIFLGSLLFGKRAAPILFLACAGSLILIGALELKGILITTNSADVDDILVQVVLLAAEAFLVWITMENIEINLKRAEETEVQLKESYDKTLEGWAKALEYRDRETEGHSRRVTNLCTLLALQLGLTENQLIQLHRGALLHDIGKMAIPDSILFKPGPLNESEWELMRMHPVYAKEMLEDIPYLKEAVTIPFCHHERWDGKGYPQGLKGEDIPLTSRIFTIVDHWEALNSDRPYRKAVPRDQVLNYIRDNSGIIYDPDIADTFLNLMDERNSVEVNLEQALARD
jgi:HD domain